jgi:hypothetical protein
MGYRPNIVIVTRPTRLQGLRQRWGTVGFAKFRLAAAHAQVERQIRSAPAAQEAEFDVYAREDEAYRRTLERLERELDFDLPLKTLDRSFLPSYDFSRTAVVVVVGQDGLVANTAKYVAGLPIVGVNPDRARIDGVLLPFGPESARQAVRRVLDGRFQARSVTMAQVQLNDGQRLLAFNDFFVGAASHVSARYLLEVGGQSEPQSSSGLLVSTGAGSTGWMSSVFNMAAGIAAMMGTDVSDRPRLAWEDRRLAWAVREPFVSKSSQATLVAGLLEQNQRLRVESLMPEGGVIFSDGIEADFLPFTTGTSAEIGIAQERAELVVA